MIEIGLQYGMPPTPGIIRALVRASDVSQKEEIINEINQAIAQMEQQAQQQPPVGA